MSEQCRVAIVMSRMPRLISPDAVWLSGLRACLRRIQERRHTLLLMSGTAGCELIARGARRLPIDVLELGPPEKGDDDPLRDQCLIEAADEVLVLGLRKDGNIHRLLSDRLHTGRRDVSLIDLPCLQPSSVRQELLDDGAVLWKPSPELQGPLRPDGFDPDFGRLSPPSDVVTISLPQLPYDQFLTHTTRACPGPWPRQSTEEYLDDLLDNRPDADHSGLMTLNRITLQWKVMASNKTIRGGYPMVSLTAVPLPELPALRRFRTHRSRWDFEPYGLSIRRAALERRGAREVCYGTEETWRELNETDRPFFQLNETLSDSDRPVPIDWSVEREWRHAGDLDLTTFGTEDVFVFVPTYIEARRLQPYCPWPVTLWPGELE